MIFGDWGPLVGNRRVTGRLLGLEFLTIRGEDLHGRLTWVREAGWIAQRLADRCQCLFQRFTSSKGRQGVGLQGITGRGEDLHERLIVWVVLLYAWPLDRGRVREVECAM